jgi:aubergine-like protein
MSETKIVYLSVNKNLKTKYLMKKGNNQYDRPIPGTVVDCDIVKSNLYDFFLVSTQCRQGIQTPSHYSVLYDDLHCEPEDIQKLTYKLSYMYYNYSGAVKIPAPLRYASRLATVISE